MGHAIRTSRQQTAPGHPRTFAVSTPAALRAVGRSASKVVFTTQPSNVVAGASIAPAVQVSVEDANGNVVDRRHLDGDPGHRDEPRRRDAGRHGDGGGGQRRGDVQQPVDQQGGDGLHADGHGRHSDGCHVEQLQRHAGGGEQAGLHDAAEQRGGGGEHLARGAGVGRGRQRQRGDRQHLERDGGASARTPAAGRWAAR